MLSGVNTTLVFCFELPLLFASSPLRSPARLKDRKRAKEKHREEMSAAGAAHICAAFNSDRGCPSGDQCPDAHIRVCQHFNRPSGCRYGGACKYPHIQVCTDWVLGQEESGAASAIFAQPPQQSGANFHAMAMADGGADDLLEDTSCPNGSNCTRLHFPICRAFVSPNGCNRAHCDLPHWILPPRFVDSPMHPTAGPATSAAAAAAAASSAPRNDAGGRPDPFSVNAEDVIENANNDRNKRHSHHNREVDASIDTTIEIILPGTTAIVDLAHVSEPVLAALMQIPNAAAAPAATATTSVAGSAGGIPLLLALDFHNVTDIVSPDQPIFSLPGAASQTPLPKAVVSYVGAAGKIRDATRASIQQRIRTGQVNIGVLVFKKIRASAVTAPTDAERANPNLFVASKRHAVELLLRYNGGVQKCLFVDDSEDNVAVVASCGDPRVQTLHFPGKTHAELNAALTAKLVPRKA
jgi:hypothetical protein